MAEEPAPIRYRTKAVPEGPASPIGQMDPAQFEADFATAVQKVMAELNLSEQEAVEFVRRRVTSLSPIAQELQTAANPIVEAVGPPLVAEVPPPAVKDLTAWYQNLPKDSQELLDKILAVAGGGLYQVEAFADNLAGVGQSWLQLLTGEKLQVPFAINGTFGRFLAAPLAQPSPGNLGIDTADNVQLNVAGEVVITGGAVEIEGPVDVVIQGTPTVEISGTVDVEIEGTPTVTISGTPAVTISGTPTVTISGSPTFIIGNASIDVANISYGTVTEAHNLSNGTFVNNVSVAVLTVTNTTSTTRWHIRQVGLWASAGSSGVTIQYWLSKNLNATAQNPGGPIPINIAQTSALTLANGGGSFTAPAFVACFSAETPAAQNGTEIGDLTVYCLQDEIILEPGEVMVVYALSNQSSDYCVGAAGCDYWEEPL